VPLNPLPFREVKRKLEAAGFSEKSQKGSHVKFGRQTDAGLITTIVPNHREVAVGTLRSIIRQAQLTVETFEEL
jgi:predicted RNA binding protein YcfA (HicA-like mRNA interferase family)